MKIIKEGNVNRQVTCPICGCIYEFDRHDIREDHDYSYALTTYLPTYAITKYVECPCCGERHNIGVTYSHSRIDYISGSGSLTSK